MEVMNIYAIISFGCFNFMLTECVGQVAQEAQSTIVVAQSTKAVTKSVTKSGVRLQLTSKGMDYAVHRGLSILKGKLLNKRIVASGESGKLQYSVDMKITSITFGNVHLTPVRGSGMRVDFSKLSVRGSGTARYRYNLVLFTLSDHVDLTFTISDVSINVFLLFGVSKGHPTVGVERCSANIGDVDLSFHGIKGWIYSLFSGLIKDTIKSTCGGMICKAVAEGSERVTELSAAFPIIKKVDRWAQIDYGLISAPEFTSTCMDVLLKGEFQRVSNPKESNLTVPRLQMSSDAKKMIYVWITDYTFNTAGEVYQAANQFHIEVNAWDKKLPQEIKDMLNTKTFFMVIPQLQAKYPNSPMSIKLALSAPSRVVIDEEEFTLALYARTTFYVKDKKEKVIEVFCIQFNITTRLSVNVSRNNITGNMKDFKYESKLLKSNIGKILSFNEPLIKLFVEGVVISRANSILRKGLTIPDIGNVRFTNAAIKLDKNVIRIGSDIDYIG